MSKEIQASEKERLDSFFPSELVCQVKGALDRLEEEFRDEMLTSTEKQEKINQVLDELSEIQDLFYARLPEIDDAVKNTIYITIQNIVAIFQIEIDAEKSLYDLEALKKMSD